MLVRVALFQAWTCVSRRQQRPACALVPLPPLPCCLRVLLPRCRTALCLAMTPQCMKPKDPAERKEAREEPCKHMKVVGLFDFCAASSPLACWDSSLSSFVSIEYLLSKMFKSGLVQHEISTAAAKGQAMTRRFFSEAAFSQSVMAFSMKGSA